MANYKIKNIYNKILKIIRATRQNCRYAGAFLHNEDTRIISILFELHYVYIFKLIVEDNIL